MDILREEQKAKVLAFLLLSEITGNRCTLEDLSCACLAFPVTAEEIRSLCNLPNVPLRLLDNDRLIEVTKSFHIRFTSLLSLLHNQASDIGTGMPKYVIHSFASRKDECLVSEPRSTCEPIGARSCFEGVNAIQLEPAVRDIQVQVESSNVLLLSGNGLDTSGSMGYNHNENPSSPRQRSEDHRSAVHAANPDNLLQRNEDSRVVTHDGGLCAPLERAGNGLLPTPQVEFPSNALQRTDKIPLAAEAARLAEQGLVPFPKEISAQHKKPPEQAENGLLPTPQVEFPSNALQRTDKTPLAAEAARLAEQGLVPFPKEISAQHKKKSRDSRSVPRFEDYAVDGQVGAGGYGTVYKVRRHLDGQVFAMKCPLENTHDSNVRNEINMLKRLRGKDYIIQFQSEANGKISPNSDGGGGEEDDCPSILLEFIDHDKPEILKKEIMIDELKYYSFSLFKALAQLHKERILHLDVKPGNFLFSRSTKRGCLVDFNLARDESAKRLSTRRPVRRSSRPVTAETKTLERRKCPKRTRGHEEKTRTSVQPSKRSRKLFQCYADLATPPANAPCIGDQSKQASRAAASKDATVTSSKYQQLLQSRSISATGAITAPVKHAEKNTDNAQQVEPSKSKPKNCGRYVCRGHRLKGILDGINKASFLPTSSGTQTTGVSAIKPNPNKRVPAGLPPPPQSVQPPSAKRVKSALKAPVQQVKDGPCVGTKGYRAPEVLMRSTRQTTKVDIWSAGVSLLQLVTGRSPFPSTSTEGALKDIAKLRGSVATDSLAKSLGQRHRFSKDQPYPGVSVKEWAEKYSKRTDLKGRIPSTLYDLIEKCLDVNPDSRITAEAALLHQFCSIDDTAEFSKHPISYDFSGSDMASVFPDGILCT